MTQEAIQIRWTYGTELILLKGVTGAPQKITTKERWDEEVGTPVVSYVANVEAFSRSDKHKTLRLRYDKEEQTDERVVDPKNEVRWGVSVIKWDTFGLTASADWIDVEQWSGPARKVTVHGVRQPVTSLRKSVSVIVKMRPQQRALRDALLLRDQSCVLTAEKEASALEAAHIVPVKAGGHEVVENAILLRADLHRLFDAGLFWFKLSGGEAVVRHSKGLSDGYAKVLTGARLPESTFDRVKLALRNRATLRDANRTA